MHGGMFPVTQNVLHPCSHALTGGFWRYSGKTTGGQEKVEKKKYSWSWGSHTWDRGGIITDG